MIGNYHARCGVGEKPEVVIPEAYLSLLALPDDYCSLLSTMRSREISSVIIIQNLAQIKALFKETWETIPGNCDTLIYLGGNEQTTHKYISELLGKATIDKKTNGETRGRQGSSSRNYDVIGRELLTPDEARKFDNKKCLIFIRGFDPIEDQKFSPFGHKAFAQTEDGGAAPYVHQPGFGIPDKRFEILNEKSLKYFEKLAEKGENVFINKMTYEEFAVMTELDIDRRFMDNSLEYVDPKLGEEYPEDAEVPDDADEASEGNDAEESAGESRSFSRVNRPENDSIMTRMTTWKYSDDQIKELHKAYQVKMPMEEILKFFFPDTSAEEMSRIISGYEAKMSGKR